ncbi:MAG TPA: CRISPR system precrRNA processing endoribonuclease RAMP protein Cas6 [Geobacteraceae bacterium]|nr:CRISPR system precrRNA processing endoribonuclease RAMP protein Cas6 [Geobacteraceae bacterium]
MDIPLVHLVITLEHAGGETPQGLFALKKLFPAAFRRVVGCATAAGECGGGTGCPCRATFGQQLTPDPAALRRYQKPPLPFAFRVPPSPVKLKRGEITELFLTLVGEATNLLDLYLESIASLFPLSPATPLKMICRKIEALAGDGTRILLRTGRGPLDISSLPLLTFAEAVSPFYDCSETVTLELLSPLRLLHQGVPLRELPFPFVAGALFRRISSLAYYYGGVELSHDFKWLAQRSRTVECLRSELAWVNRGGGVQGVEGRVTYRGELEEFLPFLALGTRLNLGKGAAYGMGSYKLVTG